MQRAKRLVWLMLASSALAWILSSQPIHGVTGKPNLDRIASEGIRFTQFYAGSTVCAPSRSVLMTGKHMGHARARGNAPRTSISLQPLRTGDRTLAHVFKDAGNATALLQW